jgi:hypothetical protein
VGGPPPEEAAPAAPVAVIAAHGDLAAGLVSAVAQITGRGALLAAVSNRGRGPSELEAELRALVDAGPVRAVFTDLPGGAARWPRVGSSATTRGSRWPPG